MPLTRPLGPFDVETVYRDYYKSVYNYIYSLLLRREAAEDLTADVFVAVASHLDKFDPARGSLAAWIFTIARHLTQNYCMRASTRLEEICGTLPERMTPEANDKDDSLREPDSPRVERILRGLSNEERDFLELRYAMHLSNEEIAERENISAAAVSQRYHRLLAKCRKIDREM